VLKLPPPIWALLYLIAAGALSWMYPWRRLIDLRVLWLGVALIAIGLAVGFWAVSLFRLKGTEINPTSETNKSLIIRGPYRFTRNPMYLGLVVLTLGVGFTVGSLPISLFRCYFSRQRIGCISPSKRRKCTDNLAPLSARIQARSVAGFELTPQKSAFRNVRIYPEAQLTRVIKRAKNK